MFFQKALLLFPQAASDEIMIAASEMLRIFFILTSIILFFK